MNKSRLTLNDAAFAIYSGPAMACADEGYRLALLLTLDETAAFESLSDAYENLKFALDKISNREDALLCVAKLIYEQAKDSKKTGSGKEFGLPVLDKLDIQQRGAIGMIDLLGLTYEDATEAIGCEDSELVKFLASARSQLMS